MRTTYASVQRTLEGSIAHGMLAVSEARAYAPAAGRKSISNCMADNGTFHKLPRYIDDGMASLQRHNKQGRASPASIGVAHTFYTSTIIVLKRLAPCVLEYASLTPTTPDPAILGQRRQPAPAVTSHCRRQRVLQRLRGDRCLSVLAGSGHRQGQIKTKAG